LNDAAPPRADDEGRSTSLPQSKSPTFATKSAQTQQREGMRRIGMLGTASQA
jgi:hypothetical protein